MRLRADPRYRVQKWPHGNTIAREGPCPKWRHMPEFEPSPNIPPQQLACAQLSAVAAARICTEHRQANQS